MKVYDNVAEMRAQSRRWKMEGERQAKQSAVKPGESGACGSCRGSGHAGNRCPEYRIAFVPTMGCLHDGHLSLVKLAKRMAERVVVSIFVNPSQFNQRSDFERYVLDLKRDLQCLQDAAVDAVFTPREEDIYGSQSQQPVPFQSWVVPELFSEVLEGASRPGHFRGVATVVSMLFLIVEPDLAIFGEKDFQQLRVIERLVSDLHFPLRIVRGPLVREADGLAMSSRNARLSPAGRRAALKIWQGLAAAREAAAHGEHKAAALEQIVLGHLSASDLIAPDYVKLVDQVTLQPLETLNSTARLLAAVVVDGVRLIDNVELVML